MWEAKMATYPVDQSNNGFEKYELYIIYLSFFDVFFNRNIFHISYFGITETSHSSGFGNIK